MKIFDHLDLDGHLLKLLVLVVETGSITRTAMALGITQSAVSHQVERLRAITGDALFVKSGRGIVPTSRAQALAAQASLLLGQLQAFVHLDAFDPKRLTDCFTVAANDFQRDLFLPSWLARLQSQAPGVSLRVIPSDIPSAELLRAQDCTLAISPRPPDASDIVHRRMLTDRYRVFFDPECRKPPRTRKAYEAARHVTITYPTGRHMDIDDQISQLGIQRQIDVHVSGFSGVAAFIRGSDRIATLPGLLRHGMLSGLSDVPVPVPTPEMPMYAIWHVRHQGDPVHQWLRQTLFDPPTLGATGVGSRGGPTLEK